MPLRSFPVSREEFCRYVGAVVLEDQEKEVIALIPGKKGAVQPITTLADLENHIRNGHEISINDARRMIIG